MPCYLKDWARLSQNWDETNNESAIKICIPNEYITINQISKNRFEYEFKLDIFFRNLNSSWTLCAVKIASQTGVAESQNGIVGMFLKMIDSTGFKRSLFGFPGDFNMGPMNSWIEPVYPLTSKLINTCGVSLSFESASSDFKPSIQLAIRQFNDISISGYIPLIFTYETSLGSEDNTKLTKIGGVFIPGYKGIKSGKEIDSDGTILDKIKIVPSCKTLSKGLWQNSAIFMYNTYTIKDLESSLVIEDSQIDPQQHVQ